MYHCKVMIVDGQWVSAGSTNFDNRSFRLNDEANLNVLDRDRAQSRSITLDQWRHRPLKEKLLENALALFRSQI